jgi:hypothetical protein
MDALEGTIIATEWITNKKFTREFKSSSRGESKVEMMRFHREVPYRRYAFKIHLNTIPTDEQVTNIMWGLEY